MGIKKCEDLLKSKSSHIKRGAERARFELAVEFNPYDGLVPMGLVSDKLS
jgi:hypothetical protein